MDVSGTPVILGVLALDSDSDDEVISRFLALPMVKAPQFSLVVTLGSDSNNGTKLKAEEKYGLLHPL